MQQSGDYEIAAPMQTVWNALNDADVLGECIPGCQEITHIDDEHFSARVKARVGPVSATFQAELALKDLQPPHSYVIEGGVKGGAAGFGKGNAAVQLQDVGTPDAPLTHLSYTVDASVGGKLAQIGSRLVDGAARKMADDFFAAFSARVGHEPVANSTAGTAMPELATANTGVPATETSHANQTQTQRESETDGDDTQTPAPKPAYEGSGHGLIWAIVFLGLATALLLAF